MKGSTFTMLLGEAPRSSVSVFLRKYGFMEVGEGAGWRAELEEEGYLIKVFVKYDGREVKFLLPEPSAPDEVNRRVVERIASELYKCIHGVKMPPENLKLEDTIYSFCYYCLKPVKELLFRCRRCGGRYCSEHHLPEKHRCPGARYIKTDLEEGERRETEVEKEVIVKRPGE